MSNPTEKPAMLREQLALLQFAARNVAHAEATYNADALSCLSSVRATTEILIGQAQRVVRLTYEMELDRLALKPLK